MEKFEGPPKRSLVSIVKERLQNLVKKKPAPVMPEGAKPEPSQKKQILQSGNLEDMVLDKVAFEKALTHLTPKSQEAVRLVYVEHKSFHEAAQELGITDTALHNRLQRAYSEIRFRMQAK